MSHDSSCDTTPCPIASPDTRAPGAEPARSVESASGHVSEPPDPLPDGAPGRPFILDYGGTRNLFFSSVAVQSSMHLDDPRALIVPYTRKMMAFLLFRPEPRHVLMIGLGGGSLAKFCYHHLPHTRVSVVEISAAIIAMRDEFAVPRDDERFEIIHDDGAAYLASAHVRPDIILIDAFDDVGVSPSLAASDFYRRASERLTPDGVLVMNLSGLKSRWAAHVENLRAAFPGPIRMVQVEGDDNVLLFAFGHEQVAELSDFLQHRAQRLEHGLGLEFSRYLERLRAGHLLGVREAE